MSRVDRVKPGKSSPGCDKTRTITKNCGGKQAENIDKCKEKSVKYNFDKNPEISVQPPACLKSLKMSPGQSAR